MRDAMIHRLFKHLPIQFPVSRIWLGKTFEYFLPTSKTGTRTIQTSGGALTFDLSSDIERYIFYFFYNLYPHYLQSPLGLLIPQTLKSGDVFVDIGANFGFYSLIASQCGARCALFEPESKALNFLRKNEGVFRDVFPLALSDEEGHGILNVAKIRYAGSSSIVSTQTSEIEIGYSHQNHISTNTFDAVVEKFQWMKTGTKLIKIDCEGAEEKIVNGMRSFLAQNQSKDILIWCEVRGPSSLRMPNSYLAVIKTMKEHGFSPFFYDGKIIEPFADYRTQQVFDLLFSRSTKGLPIKI